MHAVRWMTLGVAALALAGCGSKTETTSTDTTTTATTNADSGTMAANSTDLAAPAAETAGQTFANAAAAR